MRLPAATSSPLTILDEADAAEGSPARSWSFDTLARRSDQVAAWLAQQGVRKGDAVIVMLGNQVELWEAMLGIIKLGAVIMPTTTAVGPADLRDRIDRGAAGFVIANAEDTGKFADVPGDYGRLAVTRGGCAAELGAFDDAYRLDVPPAEHPGTAPTDRLLLYFTSGTTSRPKLVEHTQVSYPVGHLTTMYWLGLETGDVHLNISSPGWAKHAWSCFFAPWNAEAQCSSTTTRGSTRQCCWGSSATTRSPRCARRPRCGGCSSTPTSPAVQAGCARSSGPENR